MTIPTMVSNLQGRDDAGDLQTGIACRFVSDVTRSIGLLGDVLAVEVKAEDWGTEGPDDWDLHKPFAINLGHSDTTITLDGYRIQRVIDVQRGGGYVESEPTTPQPHSAKIIRIEFITEPGYWREGRGGVLFEQTLNPLKPDGTVDDAHGDYNTNSELVSLAITAMGFTPGTLPASLDDHDPIGPIDWHNASALRELESLLSQLGHTAVYSNAGDSIEVVKLPLGNEDVTLDTAAENAAEPYDLFSAPALRGRTVLVTSGRTRSTVITTRTLGSTSPLKWVWFDPKTQRFLDATETQTEYPGSTDPDDIDAYKAGPGVTVESKAQYARLFRALRVGDDDLESLQRLATIRDPVTFLGEEIAGRVAVVQAKVVRPQGLGVQYINEPSSGLMTIEGIRVVPEHGVVVLPNDVDFVQMSPGPIGGRADAVALGSSDLTLFIAHEANTGDEDVDFFIAGWTVDTTVSPAVLDPLDSAGLDAALADPDTITLEAPFLRRVLTNEDGSPTYTAVNDSELTDIAERIAEAHAGASMVKSAIIELRGFHDIEPGAFGGCVSQVRWSILQQRTILYINQHEVPASQIARLQRQAKRSFATGLSAYSPNATAIDHRSARSIAPSSVSGDGERAERGAEQATAPRIRDSADHRVIQPAGFVLAKITGNEVIPMTANRWRYTWEQVTLDTDGDFVTVTGGLTSTTHGKAVNGAEAGNTGTGVEGNGVDRDNLPGTFEMQPVATGTVQLLLGPIDDGAGAMIWMMVGSPPNSDDGDCEEPV